MKKNNKYVMELIMIYENNGGNEKKVYRLLSCVVYSLIYCYVCIDYISCHLKTLSSISSKPTFEETIFNIKVNEFGTY